MTIDITPEAVERLINMSGLRDVYAIDDTLRALSAALTASQAETAAAYEAAAQVAIQRKSIGSDTMPHPYDTGYLAACKDIANAIRTKIGVCDHGIWSVIWNHVRFDCFNN